MEGGRGRETGREGESERPCERARERETARERDETLSSCSFSMVILSPSASVYSSRAPGISPHMHMLRIVYNTHVYVSYSICLYHHIMCAYVHVCGCVSVLARACKLSIPLTLSFPRARTLPPSPLPSPTLSASLFIAHLLSTPSTSPLTTLNLSVYRT